MKDCGPILRSPNMVVLSSNFWDVGAMWVSAVIVCVCV